MDRPEIRFEAVHGRSGSLVQKLVGGKIAWEEGPYPASKAEALVRAFGKQIKKAEGEG